MEGNQKVWWISLNGERCGIITGKTPLGYMVRRPDGKSVIVHPKSIFRCQEIERYERELEEEEEQTKPNSNN